MHARATPQTAGRRANTNQATRGIYLRTRIGLGLPRNSENKEITGQTAEAPGVRCMPALSVCFPSVNNLQEKVDPKRRKTSRSKGFATFDCRVLCRTLRSSRLCG